METLRAKPPDPRGVLETPKPVLGMFVTSMSDKREPSGKPKSKAAN